MMLRRITALVLAALMLISSGCAKNKTEKTTETESDKTTENYMLKYGEKTINEEYYVYLLSMTKYDFLDTYLSYAEEYKTRGLDFGADYFGTEIADTEEFWNAELNDGGNKVNVSELVKKQTMTLAKCVAVFETVMKDCGFEFSDSVKKIAEENLKKRAGQNVDQTLSHFGVSREEALFAELASAGLNELKSFVCAEGGAAGVTKELVEAETAKSVRYKAISYYGVNRTVTSSKANASFERIKNGESDFDEEMKKSDDYSLAISEFPDGTKLDKEEFCSIFEPDESVTFLPGEIFTAVNDRGAFVIRIVEPIEQDIAEAQSAVSDAKFSEFLRKYTSNIEIDENAVEAVDFFKAARI